jgi:peptidoglycan hydrolase CwlO-like protein
MTPEQRPVAMPESMPVQLTRMEGKLDRITDRVDDLRSRVDSHEVSIDNLKSQTQSLKEGAEASKETAVALALALKDAKETQEATARAEAAKSDSSWSPVQKMLAVIAGVAVLWGVLQSIPGAL